MKVLKAEFKPQSIKYRGGYKYQLAERYGVYTRIRPEEKLIQPFIILRPSGHLSIGPGYAWDGPSGPTFDTPNFMRGSLIHDALYRLMRNGLLREDFREDADKEIKKACLEDGMTRFRAAYVGSSAEFVGKTVFHRRLRRPRCSPSLKASLASSAAAPALTLGCAPRCRLVWAMGNGASGGGSGHRV